MAVPPLPAGLVILVASCSWAVWELVSHKQVPTERVGIVLLACCIVALLLHETRPFQWKQQWDGDHAEDTEKKGKSKAARGGAPKGKKDQ